MKTVIVILGAARSGSTLLAKAIGGHSSCFAIGEINRFNYEINSPETHCGCAEKLKNCNFWISLLDELRLETKTELQGKDSPFRVGIFKQITKISKIHKLILTILLKVPYRNKQVDSEIDNTFILFDKLFNKTQSTVLVDATKGLFRALILASRAKNDVQFRFVHLTRDGRGVLNSSLKTSYGVKHKDGSLKKYVGPNNRNPNQIINSWLYINIRNFIILKIFRKDKTLFLNYEDFTSNPSKYLNEIYKKVNLSYEKEVLDLGKHENHILGGNASRINAKSIKKQDDAWITNLDVNLLKKFKLRAGWFNKLLGYN